MTECIISMKASTNIHDGVAMFSICTGTMIQVAKPSLNYFDLDSIDFVVL